MFSKKAISKFLILTNLFPSIALSEGIQSRQPTSKLSIPSSSDSEKRNCQQKAHSLKDSEEDFRGSIGKTLILLLIIVRDVLEQAQTETPLKERLEKIHSDPAYAWKKISNYEERIREERSLYPSTPRNCFDLALALITPLNQLYESIMDVATKPGDKVVSLMVQQAKMSSAAYLQVAPNWSEQQCASHLEEGDFHSIESRIIKNYIKEFDNLIISPQKKKPALIPSPL